MNKTKLIIVIIITTTILVVIGVTSVFPHSKWERSLVSPNLQKIVGQISKPSAVPSPSPKQFKFDSSTNLNQELDSVDPQIEDGDFEDMNSLMKQMP